jgi:hypothetical protein
MSREVTLSQFSFAYYKHMLEVAKASGFAMSSFKDFRSLNRKSIILRHDVDYTINGVIELAEIEASVGATATYMFRVHAHEYNLFSPHVATLIASLREIGHEIGLHYEATSVGQALNMDARELLKKEIAVMEELVGFPIFSGAEHRDVSHAVHKVPYYHDLHDPREFFKYWAMDPKYCKEMKYLSDSNGFWREGDLLQHIEQHDRIQVLTHPDWWFDTHLLLKGPYFHGRGN